MNNKGLQPNTGIFLKIGYGYSPNFIINKLNN